MYCTTIPCTYHTTVQNILTTTVPRTVPCTTIPYHVPHHRTVNTYPYLGQLWAQPYRFQEVNRALLLKLAKVYRTKKWWIFPFLYVWFFHILGNNNPNWRTHIFQRGRSTTNQFWWWLGDGSFMALGISHMKQDFPNHMIRFLPGWWFQTFFMFHFMKKGCHPKPID